MPKRKMIAGIPIPKWCHKVAHGKKRQIDGRWVLSTKNGRCIATFTTESALDRWWNELQRRHQRLNGCSTLRLVQPEMTTIKGVSVPRPYLGLMNAYKCCIETVWFIVAPRGYLLARFSTEEDLERWWKEFQFSQGRSPRGLILLKFAKRRSEKPDDGTVVRKQWYCGIGVSAENKPTSDPLKPWSEKYDMPEFDAESFGRM